MAGIRRAAYLYPNSVDPFGDRFEFQDEVFGPGKLNEVERDLIDTPEFQRLFRTSQLGFVDLVYQCANHTRGVHSIGCCFWAKRLVRTLNENQTRFARQQPIIGRTESALISIAALLHDISHGPYAHDIEKKTHQIYPNGLAEEPKKIKSAYGPYEKHDDYGRNAVLFVTLLRPDMSVVARVLERHSPVFWSLLRQEANDHRHHLSAFVQEAERSAWQDLERKMLPSLLFHLLVFEKIGMGLTENAIELASDFRGTIIKWGLGPEASRDALHRAWYQPYRHDIIGDTLSADLIDYLHRDTRRLGISKAVDLKLLDSYVMVAAESADAAVPEDEPDGHSDAIQGSLLPRAPTRYRCAIDLMDAKRGTVRMERLNDLFRLLDLRHEIHEKAVFHRVVQSAIAMMSRALLRMPKKPSLEEIYGFSSALTPATLRRRSFFGDAHRPGKATRRIQGRGSADCAKPTPEARGTSSLPADAASTLGQ